jgi:hypothetical protein
MSKKEWLEKVRRALEEKKSIGLIWFIQEFTIEITPGEKKFFNYRIEHGTRGFGESELKTAETILRDLESKEKPDMIMIDGKEVK